MGIWKCMFFLFFFWTLPLPLISYRHDKEPQSRLDWHYMLCGLFLPAMVKLDRRIIPREIYSPAHFLLPTCPVLPIAGHSCVVHYTALYSPAHFLLPTWPCAAHCFAQLCCTLHCPVLPCLQYFPVCTVHLPWFKIQISPATSGFKTWSNHVESEVINQLPAVSKLGLSQVFQQSLFIMSIM